MKLFFQRSPESANIIKTNKKCSYFMQHFAFDKINVRAETFTPAGPKSLTTKMSAPLQ